MPEFEISVDALRARKLYIGTPMYDGKCHGEFAAQLQLLLALLLKTGVECRIASSSGDVVNRARNKMAAEVLVEDWTDLLFLDGDIKFTPEDVLVLLGLSEGPLDDGNTKLLIGAPYAKKQLEWERIKQAVLAHPEIAPGDLAAVGCAPVLGWLADGEVRLDLPQRVRELGTGMLLIRRPVLERMAAQYPELRYEPMVGELAIPSYDFFSMGKNPEPPHNWLSEDYFFEARWRAMGGSVWVCPWMVTHHIGTQAFPCDLALRARYSGSI